MKQEGSWMMVTGAVLIVIGFVLGLYLRAYDLMKYPDLHLRQPEVRLHQDGDPPVTVSDGSLDAGSVNGWKETNESTALHPKGAGASAPMLTSACDHMVGPTKLVRYYDGLTYWDVPLGVGQPLYVIIRHGGQPVVITTDSLHGNLTISDPAPGGGFGPPGNDYHHKARRKLDGHIDGVSYKDTFGADVTMPAPVNHNASVDFCYQ